MANRRSSRRGLEIAWVSVICVAPGWGLAGCSSTENSDSKGASAGSSTGGQLTSAAGASSSMSGAASGSLVTAGAGTGSGGAGNLSGAASGGVSGSGGPAGGAASLGGVGGTSAGGASVGERSPEATCTRWKADMANLDEGSWSGSVDGCVVGDISADGRENALRFST